VREVLEAVEQVLALKPHLAPRGRLPLREIRGAHVAKSPLKQVAQLLHSGRQYSAVTVFLSADSVIVRAASAGPAPRCDFMRLGEGNVGQAARTGDVKVAPDVSRDPQYVKVFDETRSELVVPIKIGEHVIGVIDVESDRLNAFSYKERVLLRRIAVVLAKFLVGPGKYLVMKAREWAVANKPAAAKQPQPERQGRLRAAAGEKARS
jgi:putative methionine-R-sulfoxide reductase with GAF domain